MRGKEVHGFLFAVLSILCGSGMAIFVKLSSQIPVTTIVFSRFLLGVPIFLWILRKKGMHLTVEEVPKNLLRSVAGIGALYAYYSALHLLPLVNAVTLSNTAPLFLPLIIWLSLKQMISKRRGIAILLGFLGVVIILRPEGSTFLVLGSVLGLLAGFCRSVAMLNVRILAKSEATEKILAYYFLIGAVLSFFPLIFNFKLGDEPIQWLYVFISAIFALGFQYLFTKACAHLEASKVSSVSYLSVISGALFGWWIFNEIPDLWFILGASLIIIGATIALFDQVSSKK